MNPGPSSENDMDGGQPGRVAAPAAAGGGQLATMGAGAGDPQLREHDLGDALQHLQRRHVPLHHHLLAL